MLAASLVPGRMLRSVASISGGRRGIQFSGQPSGLNCVCRR